MPNRALLVKAESATAARILKEPALLSSSRKLGLGKEGGSIPLGFQGSMTPVVQTTWMA
jgi:hypothetical protein